jgi:uncharacterized protein YeaO (DUF488 family)
MPRVRTGRVYDDPEDSHGQRVLVDRIWPRGLSKQKAALDVWLKDVAPSTELRTWYAHDPAKYDVFAGRYRAELEGGAAGEALEQLRALSGNGTVILLTATRDLEHSQAAVLAELLNEPS